MIPLTKGKFAVVDAGDFVMVAQYDWYASKSRNDFYAVRNVIENGRRTKLYMHRFIMDCPSGMVVHHINGDTLDNRRSNLEVCTVSLNQYYCSDGSIK